MIKESVMVLLPIFMIFLIMHAVLIGGSLLFNVGKIGETATHVVQGVSGGVADPNFGLLAMLMVFLHAYSLVLAPTPASRRSPTVCPSCASRAWRPVNAPCVTWRFRWR